MPFGIATIAFKLLGFGKTLLSWGKSALGWIVRDWRHILIAILSLFAAYQLLEAGKYSRAHDRAVASLERAKEGIAKLETASAESERLAKANAARVKAEYERIAENAKVSYDRALADNRATVKRWKLQNSGSATSQGDSAAPAEVSTGIAGAETVPVIPRGFVLLPDSDLDKMADIQATLFALQKAAREAMGVQTSPEQEAAH